MHELHLVADFTSPKLQFHLLWDYLVLTLARYYNHNGSTKVNPLCGHRQSFRLLCILHDQGTLANQCLQSVLS